MEQLVTTEWLAAELGEQDLCVLECTVYLRRGETGLFLETAQPDWVSSHIPGSAFADLIDSLSDPDALYPCMAPDEKRFAAGMEALGVGDATRVVLYDRGSSVWATRLWWLLRAFGFDNAAVLDGGWRAWTSEGRAVSSDPAPDWPQPRATFTPRRRARLIASKDDVLASLDQTGTCIVNALSADQHRGADVGLPRPGHIPGALNIASADLLDPQSNRFLPPGELAARFGDVIHEPRVITYCGGGIAATADAFVLTLLGHSDVAVYDGSMEEWAADPALPLELGD